ncbi:MAG: hypothetical protein IPK97_00035 [Ahniella sp.]|nr:hypothetical protein [Ahniella sp.]
MRGAENRFRELHGHLNGQALTGSDPAIVNIDRNVFVGVLRGVEIEVGAVALTTRVRNNSFSLLNNSLVFATPGSGLVDVRVANNLFAKVDNAVVIPATGLSNLLRSRNLCIGN